MNFIAEKTKIQPRYNFSINDGSSLYTNVPQEEGTNIVCKAHEEFHNYNPGIPTRFLRQMLGFVLSENSPQLNGYNYLQTRDPPWGQKRQSLLLIFFMAPIETKLIQQNGTKPTIWKRDIDDISSL